ncbi:MAG: hybrid sensor histidine kinase/response regulator [Ignavibacteriae bacterium]|nr:hybrid sensor histidine kinase/response regulator [Ignavibacteriota bacterium]
MQKNKNNINILIVDDDNDDIFLTRELLEDSKNLNFNIDSSNTFEEGLQKLSNNKLDVALIDYRLGERDGIDLIKNAKERGLKTPFILLTGNGNYEIDFEAMESGASDFLSKGSLDSIGLGRSIRYAMHQNKIEEELRLSNQTKDKFFSIIAHDLKNPFGAITNYSEYLLSEFNNLTNDEIKEDINCIHNVSISVTHLLENLLHWARIQTGGFIYDPQQFDITELIERVIILNSEVAKLKNVHLSSEVEHPIFVQADSDMINVVLRNLVSNAIKFTNEEGKVTISIDTNENEISVQVSDTGVGIPKNNLQDIFKIDSSFTSLGTNNEKGTGLGLVLCQDLVEQNKGKINVKSDVDKGSQFTFTLPQ